MKHNDAKALVFAMFGSKKISTTGASKMISPLVQQAYNEAFGEYPPKDINEQMIWKKYWATRLREIADALENCCSECDGQGGMKGDMNPCEKCKGQGHVRITTILDATESKPLDVAGRADFNSNEADIPPTTAEAMLKVIGILEGLEEVGQRKRVVTGLSGLYDVFFRS